MSQRAFTLVPHPRTAQAGDSWSTLSSPDRCRTHFQLTHSRGHCGASPNLLPGARTEHSTSASRDTVRKIGHAGFFPLTDTGEDSLRITDFKSLSGERPTSAQGTQRNAHGLSRRSIQNEAAAPSGCGRACPAGRSHRAWGQPPARPAEEPARTPLPKPSK